MKTLNLPVTLPPAERKAIREFLRAKKNRDETSVGAEFNRLLAECPELKRYFEEVINTTN